VCILSADAVLHDGTSLFMMCNAADGFQGTVLSMVTAPVLVKYANEEFLVPESRYIHNVQLVYVSEIDGKTCQFVYEATIPAFRRVFSLFLYKDRTF